MSGLLLSGCDFTDRHQLTKKQVIELKQYCIRSNADTYRLDSGNLFKNQGSVRKVICIYIDEEADARYEVDAFEIKKREESENGN